MKVSWFPGHMKKAQRLIRESLPLVDLVLMLLDARIPGISRNDDIERIITGKKILYLLNKSDLAEEHATAKWCALLREEGGEALPISSRTGFGCGSLKVAIERSRRGIVKKRQSKGRFDENIRLLVLGIPNVGKSTLINTLAGKNQARVGKKPGVTRGFQWIALPSHIELIDVPGIFYPRVDSEEDAWRLAALGAVKEELFDVEEVAIIVLSHLLQRNNPGMSGYASMEPGEILEEIGRKSGFLEQGGVVDRGRAASSVLRRLREGAFGPLTLEEPVSIKGHEINE